MVATASGSRRRMVAAALFLAGSALPVSSCSASQKSGPSPVTDVLLSKTPQQIVTAAQHWMRYGTYHFIEDLNNTTTATGITGGSATVDARMNVHLAVHAGGDHAAYETVAMSANVDGLPVPLSVVEITCMGYASAGDPVYTLGTRELLLARLLAPDLQDGDLALTWHDLGPTTRGGKAVHHLQAFENVWGLSGALPSPGQTPPPGVDVIPTPYDLYISSADGSVVEDDWSETLTADFSRVPPRLPSEPTAGIVHQTQDDRILFSPSTAAVSAPRASRSDNMVVDHVLNGFGLSGVKPDTCLDG